MDVARIRFGVLSALALSMLTACQYGNDSGSNTSLNTSAKCSSTAIANQYIVQWKDGTTAVYRNHTKEEMLDNVITPHQGEIEFAEQDQRVSVPHQPKTVQAETSVPANGTWGQTITQASGAWNAGYTGTGVVVAVVDSGVDIQHNQLKNQVYVNAGETGTDHNGNSKSTNGFDDDSNGYVDDVSGYDFYNKTAAVTDGSGHGTHVSGIIAAQHSAGSAQGVAEGSKVLPLRFMDDSGSGDISAAIEAMKYAGKMGAKVINASWGGAPCSQALRQAITDLGAQGVLFVSAAGNDDADLDTQPEYPAAFNMENQITVAASTSNDYQSIYSNYSYGLAKLVAPGDSIVSTYPDFSTATTKAQNITKSLSGTSMATPFVAATAAILWQARPNATVSDIKSAILNSVDSGPFEVQTRGRLNVANALQEILKLPQ